MEEAEVLIARILPKMQFVISYVYIMLVYIMLCIYMLCIYNVDILYYISCSLIVLFYYNVSLYEWPSDKKWSLLLSFFVLLLLVLLLHVL